jgi:RimJ/RimL family protein N-acetyltransferase
MTGLVALRPAPAWAIPALIEAMSSADRTELIALSQGKPVDAIQLALSKSVYSFCWMTSKGDPTAIGGVNAGDNLTDCPIFGWMVASTPRLYQLKKSFLQMSQAELQSVQATFAQRRLVTAVDERWRKSIKVLKWLGFHETGDEINVGTRVATVLEIEP